MKSRYLLPLALLYTAALHAQFGLEAQIGGANFVGITGNAFYEISMTRTQRNIVTGTLGLGILEPDFGNNFLILHGGLNYRYKRWGAGSECSIFNGYFITEGSYGNFVDMIAYPNLNYTLLSKGGWVFRASAGAYFAFTKARRNTIKDIPIRFEGDVIPGAGLTIGYRFGSH